MVADLGLPTAIVQFRVWSTFRVEPRGATWAIEWSDDQVNWGLATEFLYATRPGGGVNEDGTPREDCAGWYQTTFNENHAAHRYWRVRQTGVAGFDHAPRSGQCQFYAVKGHQGHPSLRTALPVGRSVRTDASIEIELQDGQAAVVPPSIQLWLNGRVISFTTHKPGNDKGITLRHRPPSPLPQGTNSVRIVFGNRSTACSTFSGTGLPRCTGACL